MALENFGEAFGVAPDGVAVNTAAGRLFESGVAVKGKQAGLFFVDEPALVNGAVVLEEFAEGGSGGIDRGFGAARIFSGR